MALGSNDLANSDADVTGTGSGADVRDDVGAGLFILLSKYFKNALKVRSKIQAAPIIFCADGQPALRLRHRLFHSRCPDANHPIHALLRY